MYMNNIGSVLDAISFGRDSSRDHRNAEIGEKMVRKDFKKTFITDVTGLKYIVSDMNPLKVLND